MKIFYDSCVCKTLMRMEREHFLLQEKPGADTRMEKEEIDVDILDKTHIFHVGSLSLTEQPARDTTHYAIRRAKEKKEVLSRMIRITEPLYGRMRRLQRNR